VRLAGKILTADEIAILSTMKFDKKLI